MEKEQGCICEVEKDTVSMKLNEIKERICKTGDELSVIANKLDGEKRDKPTIEKTDGIIATLNQTLDIAEGIWCFAQSINEKL